MTEKQFVIQFLLWHDVHKRGATDKSQAKLQWLADHALLMGMHMLHHRTATPALLEAPAWVTAQKQRKSDKNAQKIHKILQKANKTACIMNTQA